MGFNSVFTTLQDVFPQVDNRILRAAAIEHSKDADAAVEFILLEVLPSFTTPDEPHVSIYDSSQHLSSYDRFDDASHTPSVCQDDVGSSSLGLVQTEDQIHFLENEVQEANKVSSESKSVEDVYSHNNHNMDGAISGSTCLDAPHAGSTIQSVNKSDNLSEDDGTDDLIFSKSNEVFHGSVAGTSSEIHDDGSCQCVYNLHATIHDLNEPAPYDSGSFVLEDFDQHKSCSNVLASAENREPDATENASDRVVFDNQTLCLEVESSYASTITGSGEACKMDLLEDAIDEAKNNKKTLFLSMESVISLMREVEHQENEAEQAKEEAVRGGTDILEKAQGIKQMLQHAKEANDMHSGEVYGEKAILATEVRELQSRLLNISDERDKSLAILDEMHQALEARLAAAEEMRKAAEQEKSEKEASARKVLAEQELIMDKVVEESKRIQQEAEQNSKLRSFLMDRGHVVDALQGEISVICQDVKLLKENFDSHLPISKSLSSSQTSCLLASSGSSSKAVASDVSPEQNESSLGLGSPKNTGTSSPKTRGTSSPSSSVDGTPRSRRSNNSVRKVLVDDGWEFFDEEFMD